jgi:rod shape-determining protein MreD
MSIPLAVVGAVIAALLETSVLPELTIAGAKPDLVLVLAVATTAMIAVEDGFAWAFVGGLMLDLLTPDRQLGATSFVLLLLVGATTIAGRLVPHRRVATTVLMVAVLAVAYQFLISAVLGFSTGVAASPPLASIVPVVLLDTLLALPAALVLQVLWRRFGPHDRIEW